MSQPVRLSLVFLWLTFQLPRSPLRVESLQGYYRAEFAYLQSSIQNIKAQYSIHQPCQPHSYCYDNPAVPPEIAEILLHWYPEDIPFYVGLDDLLSSMYFCSLFQGWVDLNSSLGPWFSTLLGNSFHPVEEQKPMLQAAVYWLCVFPLEVVPLPDHKQDLFILSFHSLWVILIEASAAVAMTLGRVTLWMLCFWAPYILVKMASSPQCTPLCINTVLLILCFSHMMSWIYLSGTCQNTACLMFKQKSVLERKSVSQRVHQSRVWKYAAA